MADSGEGDVLRPTVLDRLLGDGDDRPRATGAYVGLRELRDAVARNLEWLLNSKRFPLELDRFEEAKNSLLTYGVPDFSVYSWRNPSDFGRIAQEIRTAIERFEPRLARGSIQVEPVPSDDVDDFRLRFRIDGLLHVEPVSEPVSFDTELDFESTAMKVTGTS